MTKALSGEALVLDDGPAHGRDLLVVDGNNLAHRAFHALPEAIATSWGLQSNALLFDTSPGDPLTLLPIIALLTVVAIAACLLPVRRAARLDPIASLRFD